MSAVLSQCVSAVLSLCVSAGLSVCECWSLVVCECCHFQCVMGFQAHIRSVVKSIQVEW